MQSLIDGDFASNNGGWQWSASTGTDAQPYFRVFNPARQSERFDPRGEFIGKWVPELRSLPPEHIHEPSKYLNPSKLEQLGYCLPIVDHAQARVRIIALFKKALGR
jgi:deoxyribodipyrimidine photo-lyase